MGAVSYPVPGPVKPNQEIEISLTMKAPEKDCGKYCAFFRFVYGDNLRFGQKVWCDILVEEAKEEQMKQVVEISDIEPKMEDEIESEQRVSSLLSAN